MGVWKTGLRLGTLRPDACTSGSRLADSGLWHHLQGAVAQVTRLVWWRWLRRTEAGLVHAARAGLTLRLVAL